MKNGKAPTREQKKIMKAWIGAGELACGQAPSGLIGSSEPGISEEGWRKTKDKDYIKEPVIGWKGRL